MEQFRVSVIIPVFKAERFLRDAVASAIALDETGEIILVEDGSPDGSLNVCHELARTYEKVRVVRHPNGANKGAGASRNLGILRSKFEFVSFLDADDWYLPERFARDRDLFSDLSVDGVYGATGFYFEERQAIDPSQLTTIKKPVPPEDLLLQLLTPKSGRFTTDAITLRKSLFDSAGLFDESLRLHQDTHLWLKVAHFGRLVPGITDRPVSIRRVHSGNRIVHQNETSRKLLYQKTFETFAQYSNVNPKAFRIITARYLSACARSKPGRLLHLIRLLATQPQLLGKMIV